MVQMLYGGSSIALCGKGKHVEALTLYEKALSTKKRGI
ncbi:MAG: hypothetical protein IRD7MM_02040 [Candidatus Midichloria mitochondrii]